MNIKLKFIKNVFILNTFIFALILFFNLSIHVQAEDPNPADPPTTPPNTEPAKPQEATPQIEGQDCCAIKSSYDDKDVGCFPVNNKDECLKHQIQGVNKVEYKEKYTCYDSYYNNVKYTDIAGSYCKKSEEDVFPDNPSGIVSKHCLIGTNLSGCLKNSFFPNIGLPGIATVNTGASKNLILTYLGLVINLILGFLGIIFFIIIIYAGVQWLIAADDENKVKEQKERLRNAVTGLAITLMAYGISYFVLSVLTKAS